MDAARQCSIKNSLRIFRQTVEERNMAALEILVDAMERQPDLPGPDPDKATQIQLRLFANRYLGGDVLNLASSLSHLLATDIRSDLVADFALDGVSDAPIDDESRAHWFSDTSSAIEEQGASVRIPEFPPADLKYLSSLVRSIVGPGLPYHRASQQIALLSDVDSNDRETTKHRVIIPIRNQTCSPNTTYNELTYVWEGWDIDVAVKIGEGPRGWSGSYAMFCRLLEGEQQRDWQWRYGIHDGEWCSDVYDTIEEVLDFYAHFREQTLEDVRKAIHPLIAD